VSAEYLIIKRNNPRGVSSTTPSLSQSGKEKRKRAKKKKKKIEKIGKKRRSRI